MQKMDPLFIVWNEKNNLNVPILDEQHRGIVSIINSLHYSVKQGKGFSALLPTIIMMEQYSIIHFEAEQFLLEKYEYPDSKNHFLLHARLRENLREIKTQSFMSKDTAAVIDFLKSWWINHINMEDKKHAKWMGTL